MISAALTALIVFGIFFLVCCAVFRALRISAHAMRVMGGIFVVTLPLVFLIHPVVRGWGLDGMLPDRLQFALLTTAGFIMAWAIYFQAFGLLHCSISFRLLVHFHEATDGALTLEETQVLYPFSQVLVRKINMMVGDGLIRQVEARERAFVITPAGSLMGRFFHHVRTFTGWGAGE